MTKCHIGSILYNVQYGPVAQWIEQLPSKQWVVGSIPPRTTIFFARMGKKHEAVRLRFMARNAASYTEGVLHTAQPCFIKACR